MKTCKIKLISQKTVDHLQEQAEHGLLCCTGEHAMLLDVSHEIIFAIFIILPFTEYLLCIHQAFYVYL